MTMERVIAPVEMELNKISNSYIFLEMDYHNVKLIRLIEIEIFCERFHIQRLWR